MGELSLTSPKFKHMGVIPKKYTCQGEEVNPPLQISGVPQDAKSLALIVIDPDAPMGIMVTHWVIFNLNPTTTEISEGSSIEEGMVGKNMRGKNKYMGPCPPRGTHRYIFKLYALDTLLNLDSKNRKKKVIKAMNGHIIEKTELIGTYSKQK